MIVTRDNFNQVITELSKTGKYGLDTETTGLKWKDRLFSLIISSEDHDFYFNFNGCIDNEGIRPPHILTQAHLKDLAHHSFSNQNSKWFIHHAIFDLPILMKQGIDLAGQIHCTKSAERVCYNMHVGYSLDACAKRHLSKDKDSAVEEYIKKNKLFDWEKIQGKKRREKLKKFHKVPWEIITKYGELDGKLTRKIGLLQEEILKKRPVWETEKYISKISSTMSFTGVKIDASYAQEALTYYLKRAKDLEKEFCKLSNIATFNDGRTCLVQAFNNVNITVPKTVKRNPSFADNVLEDISHPIASILQEIRTCVKTSSYYSSFLYFKDHNDVVHCFLDPSSTATGRFSSSRPNMQNVPKQDEPGLPFYARKTIIPREGTFLFCVDYDQQEYRMMVDIAGQLDLIDEINAGKNVHQASADLAGITKDHAKLLNYMLLYGGGVKKVAEALGITVKQAKALNQKYFKGLPKVKEFIKYCTGLAEERGYLRNWAGRIAFFPDTNFAYKATNQAIQGGCADVIKRAMILLDELLKNYKSNMLLQVHDELVFEIHEDEKHLCPKIKQIMEQVYKPFNGLPLTCSTTYSYESWGKPDQIEGYPGKI